MLRFKPRSEQTAGFPCPQGMPEALHRLLVGRGIASLEEARAFLEPGIDSLHDPMLLSDMRRAVERIRRAMAGGGVICVYGDYDVDGVCASAILSEYLIAQGADARVYLPSRHKEGYGLNEQAVREIARWATLLVTVDCGVTAIELVDLAKGLGLDVIVTDHHRPAAEGLPDCPVVNPLLADYPFPSLCGAGVAWKLVWALGGQAAAMAWVDVAALATVADVVPLTGENRAIVRLGLEAINAPGRRAGIGALIEAAGLSGKPVTATSIAFQLAPRLNAGGRLGSAERSLALIREKDPDRAAREAEELERENERRREVEESITAQALDQLQGFDFARHRAIILSGQGWNPGVIGLAASRLVERYNYPVILLADDGEKLTGSCRSIEGVDIHAALTGCAHTLVRFGGHRQAAGLTLRRENLEAFRTGMDAWLWEHTDPWDYVPLCRYDARLDFGEATPALVAALEALQPTGFGNPAPVFRAKARVLEARAVGREDAHLKLTLAQGGHRLGGIAFREGHRADALGASVDALFSVKLNTWMGKVEPQLEVKALAEDEARERLALKLSEEPRMQCNFLTQILYNERTVSLSEGVPGVNASTLSRWLEERPQGTLIVASDIGGAKRLLSLSERTPDLAIEALPGDPRAFNTVCLCPAPGRIPAGYERVVFCGVPDAWLPEGAALRAHRLADDPAWVQQLPDVETMRQVYRAVMRIKGRPAWIRTFFQLVHMAADEAGVADVTAGTAILAMVDMGLFTLDPSREPIVLARSGAAKAAPEDSALFNALQRWRSGQW
ncbi:MAG: single-stranded-DNA-specific exonuclease RecJ [Clostridia bacterium]|nr:single-stranded-DNA-specific exonuclease RecJ [Clostridia bacterium]